MRKWIKNWEKGKGGALGPRRAIGHMNNLQNSYSNYPQTLSFVEADTSWSNCRYGGRLNADRWEMIPACLHPVQRRSRRDERECHRDHCTSETHAAHGTPVRYQQQQQPHQPSSAIINLINLFSIISSSIIYTIVLWLKVHRFMKFQENQPVSFSLL